MFFLNHVFIVVNREMMLLGFYLILLAALTQALSRVDIKIYYTFIRFINLKVDEL